MSTYFLERRPQTNGAELALRFPLPKLFVDGLPIEKRVSDHDGDDLQLRARRRVGRGAEGRVA